MAKIFLAVSYRNTHPRVANRQRHNMNTANEFPENVAEFRYLGMRLTNQNCMNKETTDGMQRMPAAILSVILCLFVCCLKIQTLKRIKQYFFLFIYGYET